MNKYATEKLLHKFIISTVRVTAVLDHTHSLKSEFFINPGVNGKLTLIFVGTSAECYISTLIVDRCRASACNVHVVV
jgi:hypothetical protein